MFRDIFAENGIRAFCFLYKNDPFWAARLRIHFIYEAPPPP